MLAAVARKFETVAQHPNDLLFGVYAGVYRPAQVAIVAPFGGSAVVDAAGQLADDHQVDTVDDFLAQGRRRGQFLERFNRTHIGEEPQLFAQGEKRLLGTFVGLGVVPLGAADRSEQYSVAILCLLEYVVG